MEVIAKYTILAFVIVVGAMAIGDIVSTKTKAFVPSVFVTAIIFLFGYWWIFPKNIVEVAGFASPVVTLSMLLLITHMGTMMSLKELASEWKTVCIALVGIVGICLGTMTLGQLIFGFDKAVIATPPLTGGVVAALEMQARAQEIGNEELAVLAILVYIMQGFAGYPLTAIFLNKEAKRLQTSYRSDKSKAKNLSTSEKKEEKSKLAIIPPTPKKYATTFVLLLKLAVIAMLAFFMESWFKSLTTITLSKYVWCLLFGALAAEFGFLERSILNIANSFGFLITILMAFIFSGLANATPEMLARVVLPLVGIILFGVIGLMVLVFLAARFFGYSREMAWSVALTALYGFPASYILSDEASKAVGENDEERKYIMDRILPKMLVGGFTTVTVVSVIIASIFKGFIK